MNGPNDLVGLCTILAAADQRGVKLLGERRLVRIDQIHLTLLRAGSAPI